MLVLPCRVECVLFVVLVPPSLTSFQDTRPTSQKSDEAEEGC